MSYLTSFRWGSGVPYRICERCVMDTSAPEIQFDGDGVCSFCNSIRVKVGKTWFPDNRGELSLRSQLDAIRRRGLESGMEFDSILGLSGGVDSAVVAKRAIDAGLRPLAVHVDGGWNTEESVENVRNIVRELDLTLETIVIEWEEMRQLQLAFLRSGTLNQDIPQDHAFFVSLYRTAILRKIPVILSGVNYATESVQPASWGYSNSDGNHVLAINSSHGSGRLKRFPLMSHHKFQRLSKKQAFEIVRPLDFGKYDPEKEKIELATRFRWRAYGAKHTESLFTDWFQSVYLINRYGIDKRRGDYSSEIISGLRTRESALDQLASIDSDQQAQRHLSQSISEKLQVSMEELQHLMTIPHVSNHAFKTEFESWLSP